jgi:hypothetical protein
MTFRIRFYFLAAMFFAALSSCKYNSHEGEVYCEVRPLQTATGWGYEIYVDKKLYIKQAFIPAVSGIHPFKTKDDAMKTGKLVLHKITHGKLPTLTLEELRDLQVIQ